MARKPRLFWCLIALGAVFAVCFGITIFQVFRYATTAKGYGYAVQARDTRLFVTEVLPNTAADGILRSGDRIVAVDGMRAPKFACLFRCSPDCRCGGDFRFT